jgi:hypothetical protein
MILDGDSALILKESFKVTWVQLLQKSEIYFILWEKITLSINSIQQIHLFHIHCHLSYLNMFNNIL